MRDAQEARKVLQKALDRQGILGKVSRSTLRQLKVSRIYTLFSMARIHCVIIHMACKAVLIGRRSTIDC